MNNYFSNSLLILAFSLFVCLDTVAGGPDGESNKSTQKATEPASPKTPTGAVSGRADIVRPVLGPLGAGGAAAALPNRLVLFLTPNTRAGLAETDRPVLRSSNLKNTYVTPKRLSKKKRPKWGRSIYFIGILEEPENVPVVDLHNNLVTIEELWQLLQPLIQVVDLEGHRYVGKTKREVQKRFKEHAKSCETKPERRLPKALIKRAISGNPLPVHVIVANVHPGQLGQIEAWIISWVDATGDLGLNSCTGSSTGLQDDDSYLSDEETDSEEFYVDSAAKKLRKDNYDDGQGGGGFASGASCSGLCARQESAY